MGKIQHFSACRGEEYFTARPHPSRRGGFSFIPVMRLPHRRVTTGPARLHQYPRGTKLALLGPISAQAGKNPPSTLKTPQNQRFFASRASFFTPMGATATSQHPPTASPETDDTNAGGSLPQNETTGTSASSSPHAFETTDTFARTKQPNSGRFPPAKVSRVSRIPRRAPAKASPVS